MNEQCGKCGSFKTIKIGKFMIFIIIWIIASMTLFIGLLFPPLWIVTGLLILLSPISFFAEPFWQCRECNHTWKIGENKETVKKTVKATRKKVLENSYRFDVVGVTFDNDQGINIQTVLKDLIREYKKLGELESFDGMTNREIIKEHVDEFGPEGMSEFVGQYIYNRVSLVPEPNNPHDKNAIKVYLSGRHIGYVARTENVSLAELINTHNLVRNTAEFTGGRCKWVRYDNDYFIEESKVTLGVSVTLTFRSDDYVAS